MKRIKTWETLANKSKNMKYVSTCTTKILRKSLIYRTHESPLKSDPIIICTRLKIKKKTNFNFRE